MPPHGGVGVALVTLARCIASSLFAPHPMPFGIKPSLLAHDDCSSPCTHVPSTISQRVSQREERGWHLVLGVCLFREAFFVCAVSPQCPFRSRGAGQESEPILFLFLGHNPSHLCMQLIRTCFIIPTVCLYVTSLVACSYVCDDGRIGPARCALIDGVLADRCRQCRAC